MQRRWKSKKIHWVSSVFVTHIGYEVYTKLRTKNSCDCQMRSERSDRSDSLKSSFQVSDYDQLQINPMYQF